MIGIHGKATIRIHRNRRSAKVQFVSVERKELLSGPLLELVLELLLLDLLLELVLELLLWEKVILQQVTGEQTQRKMVLEQGEQVLTQVMEQSLTQVMEQVLTQVMEQVLECTSWEDFVQGVRQGVEHCVASSCSQGVETKVQVGHFGQREHLEDWTEVGHWEQDLDMEVRGR